MLPRYLVEHLAALTDDLLVADGTEAAFLAAILLRAQEALSHGSLAALCTRLWQAEWPPTEGPCRSSR
jgi:hypothetical protein